jgi:hypothetical protein
MLILAGLDFTMALLAKEYADRALPWLAFAGIANAIILFIVYARLLRTAELSVVTIGWVVFLQVGLVMMDRFRYGVEMSPGRWAAILAIVVLQAYLVLGGVDGGAGEADVSVQPVHARASQAVSAGSRPDFTTSSRLPGSFHS